MVIIDENAVRRSKVMNDNDADNKPSSFAQMDQLKDIKITSLLHHKEAEKNQ